MVAKLCSMHANPKKLDCLCRSVGNASGLSINKDSEAGEEVEDTPMNKEEVDEEGEEEDQEEEEEEEMPRIRYHQA